MKKRGIKVALVLLFMFTIIPSISMAKSNESEITSQLNNIYTPENNKELEKDGKGDKASGKAKEAVENVKEKANDVIDKFKGNKGD